MMIILFVAITTTVFCCHAAPLPSPSAVSAPQWQFAGPGGGVNAMQFNNTAQSGAANAALYVNGYWFLASVSGGVWRTSSPASAGDAAVWESVFDNQPVSCYSMTSLSKSPSSATNTFIYAGCGGSTSSQMGYAWNMLNVGDWPGFAVSNDTGSSWRMASFPPHYSVQSIMELPLTETVLVTTRGSFWNASAGGGIWRATKATIFNEGAWSQVYTGGAVFELYFDTVLGVAFASTAADTRVVIFSADDGVTWTVYNTGITLGANAVPFYSCLTGIAGRYLFVGFMLADATDLATQGTGAGSGGVYFLNLTSVTAAALVNTRSNNGSVVPPWREVGAYPVTPFGVYFDDGEAAKDRMAISINSTDERWLYVVAEGMILAFRVDWMAALGQPPCAVGPTGLCTPRNVTGIWTFMWDARDDTLWNFGPSFSPDTVNNYFPHTDCRCITWDPITGGMVLTNDGGIFLRYHPQGPGGNWISFNGNLPTFEYVSVAYDIHQDRWIGGAQDNDVQVSSVNCTQNPRAWAIGLLTTDDGTMTAADNSFNPARLFGSGQHLDALRFVQATTLTSLAQPAPMQLLDLRTVGFADADATTVPWFQMPFTLNVVNPQQLLWWANGTNDGGVGPGIFGITIPRNFTAGVDVPTLQSEVGSAVFYVPLPRGFNVMSFVAGGMMNDGAANSDIIVLMNGSGVLTSYTSPRSTTLAWRPFPAPFAEPCNPTVLGQCMSWPNHGSSMTLAVAPWNAQWIAVAGWPSLTTNIGVENVFYSPDGGSHWFNMSANLVEATGAIGKARPAALQFVPPNFLLAATTRGVFFASVPAIADVSTAGFDLSGSVTWQRLGTFSQFPLAKAQSFFYDSSVDVLITATLGRGVFKFPALSAYLSSITPTSPSTVGTSTSTTSTPNSSSAPSDSAVTSSTTTIAVATTVVVLVVGVAGAAGFFWWRRAHHAQRHATDVDHIEALRDHSQPMADDSEMNSSS